MHSTGILKPVDYAGRIVIPKDIRRNMRLQEKDLVEIYVEGEFCCFKKYTDEPNIDSLLKELSKAIEVLLESESGEIAGMQTHLEKMKELFYSYKHQPEESL